MRTWAEINLDNLKFNLAKIKEYSGNKKIIGVIKADAYGTGAEKIGRTLLENGVELLAVACLNEALELKKSGIGEEILILGCTPLEDFHEAISNGFHLTISSVRELEFIKDNELYPKIQIKVDTGMGRVGFKVKDALNAIEYIKRDNIGQLLGVYTHLSVADDKEETNYTIAQIEKFKPFEDLSFIKYRHILNSSGCVRFGGHTNTNYARAGILLHGIVPYLCEEQQEFKKVFKLKTKVLFVKKLAEKEFISYGKTYYGDVGSSIATLPVGYADGWDRRFSNGGKVEILGIECEVVGRVCMDMCMVKIPRELEGRINEGLEVTLLGEDISEKAQSIQTIPYELMTGIGKRVTKRYIKNGEFL